VLPRRLQKISHYGFLSLHSKLSINNVRDAIIDSLRNIQPDLEIEDWRVPTLRPCGNAASGHDSPRCPACGGRLVIQTFHRIRPPPMT